MSSIFERGAKAQAWIIFGLPIGAVFLAVVLPRVTRGADSASPFFWFGVAGMILGYLLLVYVKWDQIKRGDFFSWGISKDSSKALYFLSYLLMVAAFFMAGFSDRF